MKTLIMGMYSRKLEHIEDDPYFGMSKLKDFYDYLHSLNSEDRIDCNGDIDAKDELIKIKKNNQIEIIGSYADACVAATICMAMSLGIETFSHEKYLFYNNLSLENAVDKFNSPGYFRLKDLIENKLGREVKDYNHSFEKGIHIFKPIF